MFIDGEKVGVTPFSGQVLPGERLIKVELASHMPAEKKVEVPVRGRLALSESLEKVPARIVLTGLPAGTAISVDGVRLGLDKVDKPIQPGRHKVEFALEGHLGSPRSGRRARRHGDPGPHADRDRLDGFKAELEPGAGADLQARLLVLAAATSTRSWWGNRLGAKENPTKDPVADTDYLYARQVLDRSPLHGVGLEYSQEGRYFGLMVVGAAYLTGSAWRYTLEHSENVAPRVFESDQWGAPSLFVLRAVQPHLRIAFWRFMFTGQAGFEARALMLTPSKDKGAVHDAALWVVDPLFSVAGLAARPSWSRACSCEAGYRHGWDFFMEPAGLMGFNGGIGYAF